METTTTQTQEVVGLIASDINLVAIHTQMFGRDIEFTFCQGEPCSQNSFKITLKNCRRIMWNIEVDEFEEAWSPKDGDDVYSIQLGVKKYKEPFALVTRTIDIYVEYQSLKLDREM